MPVVAHTDLPTFARLAGEGFPIVKPGESGHVRQLHIGLLNLMPDAALEATERQFVRLLCGANAHEEIFVRVFTVPEMVREGRARDHIDTYYETIAEVQAHGLDALILTGANPANPELTAELFWPGMVRVIEWGKRHLCSILCSCLATHAVVRQFHEIARIKLPQKRWGVYSHRLLERRHPLVRHINSRFDAPHSHVYEVTREQLQSVGIKVLAESEVAGVHLAVSADQCQFVYFQGHPEYDANSLFKEYKREVSRFANGTRAEYPPFPENYFRPEVRELLDGFGKELRSTSERETVFLQQFPEAEISGYLENSWADTGKAMFANWLRIVAKLSPEDRQQKFGPGIDPSNPLGLGCDGDEPRVA